MTKSNGIGLDGGRLAALSSMTPTRKGCCYRKTAPCNGLHQKQTFERLRWGYSLNTEAVAYFADGASFVVTIAQ